MSNEFRAELKSFFSSDLSQPELPSDINNFSVVVQADIGILGQDGSDFFQFNFVTSDYLKNNLEKAEYLFGKGYVVIKSFSWKTIEDTLTKLTNSVSGKNWEDIATKLSRYGDWEFEDQ